MIEIRGLTKVYGRTTAVDDLTVTVRPGVVTGFLGPNGAGKSTTMRAVVGLDRPTSGEVLVDGRRYADHPAPLHQVGALLDAGAVHPGRSARNHLRALAATNGIGHRRVDEVLELVGLSEVAGRRVGGFSLGMSQRLGIAATLLGDPAVILLDEPVNGLDPDGIRWIRGLLRALAAEGRTVFVSSHLMSEMALTADHLVLLGRGRLLADVSMQQMTATATGRVTVRTPQPEELTRLLVVAGAVVSRPEPDVLTVTGTTAEEIAGTALAARILLTELVPVHASLEEAYLAMTADDVQYRSTTPATPATDPTAPRRAAA
ncbi:ABC-2 type transport system ATP-binding protein [Geodermatophilus tzadiensis]|uniref:ABC-2 type transport system ATP-binding protein n=1 Tax=Geodermatophilus tzadiensis TaxID=1137988 RepID=A0A2T0TTG1_9ACTN|nr:ATP-binding cassette domain-containing protein [Geodermatophilus tzadiensis]PRY48984.1 ABC-2 type transport system ATP-binding protein [Geodermatophilus tzadiensis]